MSGRRRDGATCGSTSPDVEGLAEEVSGYGADVVVLEPAALVAAVVRRLFGALAAHGGAR